ncbi:MAG: L,D-transpeptidase family protein [Chloroflexi bacterium]|nr:L,D-transpeptidase family protein [Chloroflexota bacterium]
MNNRFDEAKLAVQKAREAMRANNRTEARQWAEHAAMLAPQMEDPWLILAAIASPRASVEYLQRALKINPTSPRAHKGMEWATQRLRDSQPQKSSGVSAPDKGPERSGKKSPSKRSLLFPILLLGLGILVCGVAAWSASPVLASFMERPAPVAALPTHPPSWAQVYIPKPTYTPQSLAQTIIEATATPTFALPDFPTDLPTNLPTDVPTEMAVVIPTDTPEPPTAAPTWTGSISVEIVPDTPTSEIPTAAPAPDTNYVSAGGERWIDVNLSQQMVYAYEGNTVVNSFLVSTGTWETPTVTGQYHIYVKLRYTDMAGPGYYLPNVPYTMYFYRGYGLHGTYWHSNFGTPMSHGRKVAKKISSRNKKILCVLAPSR